MKTYKLFIASSMKNPWRDRINTIVSTINKNLKRNGRNIECEVFAYAQEPTVDYDRDTQALLNDKAAKSEMFILLVDNNSIVGKYTMEEYETAFEQSTKNPSHSPHIKVFVITEKDKEPINVSYIDAEGNVHEDFENRIDRDSKRYMECRPNDGFQNYFQEWLEKNIIDLFTRVTQKSLSYEEHIDKINQGIRKSNSKYFPRKKIDDEIEEKLNKSPIIILEGSTYSGKTRAAYEFMRNREEWENWNFHIYNSNHSINDLNNIRLNYTTDREDGDVYFIDDINDIIDKDENKILRVGNTIWEKLNGYNKGRGFSLGDMGNTRIIITISGKLSTAKRKSIYNTIFNANDYYAKIEEDVVVKFDIYDPKSFHEMVDEMVRAGVIKKSDIIKGNYTIGSLFIKTDKVANDIHNFAGEKGCENKPKLALIKALVGHYKYASHSKFAFKEERIQNLYHFLQDRDTEFDNYIDELRQKGLIIVDKESIFIDQSIITLFAKELHGYYNFSTNELHELLIEYADQPQSATHILSKYRMGYLLCDRNALSDKELQGLIKVIKGKDQILKICMGEDRYILQFFATAYARIQNFETAKSIINYYYKNKQENKAASTLYKRIIFAMLSDSNRTMTLNQEREILEYILNEDKSWKKPFDKDKDLKDIFNLVRISPFIDLTAEEILDFASKATIDGIDMDKFCQEKVAPDTAGFVDDYSDTNDENADISNEDFYVKVFLKQISHALISALCKAKKFEEFKEILKIIKEKGEGSVHLQNAIQRTFSYSFYKNITSIAKEFPYNDRYKLFKFIGALTPQSDLFGCCLDDYSIHRIFALNRLLELLDENDAQEGCVWMLNNNYSDKRTLSHLLKNEFVNFEQALPIIEKYEEQKNFITLNQLMKKAETISDAHACMRLMGITNGDPSKLKDEFALAQYISIKENNEKQTVKIIYDWHNKNENRDKILTETALNVILHKFSLESLFDIIDDLSIDNEPYYKEKYGLLMSEIELIRNNAMLISILFKRANLRHGEYSARLASLFERIKTNNPELIADPDKNGNTGIISIYMKNKTLFPDSEAIKRFDEEVIKPCKVRRTSHVYAVYLYELDTLDKVNDILIEAYKDFAQNYSREEVEKMMTQLYSYIPSVVKGDFNTKMSFAYENTIIKDISFKEYLEFILENKATYVNSSFVYNTLRTMIAFNEEVYNLLGKLAQHNHCGIKYETIYKKIENNEFAIPLQEVRNSLLLCKNGNLTIDPKLVSHISISKLLLFMLSSKRMSFIQAEKFRLKKQVPVTQLYLNFALRTMGTRINEDYKHSRYNLSVLENGYHEMINYMTAEMKNTSYLHKSIQMCIALIDVAPDKESLESIFNEKGFGIYRKRTEVIGARMNKLIKLQRGIEGVAEIMNDFQDEIKNNRNAINITIINTYIMMLLKILKGEIRYKKGEWTIRTQIEKSLKECWTTLNNENKIDVTKLLDLESENVEDSEMWKIDADIQTFSYFAMFCPTLISTMNQKFEGNFYYDEKGKKNCLKDAIKNYAHIYNQDSSYPEEEVERISEILNQRDNRAVQQEIFNEYILHSFINKYQQDGYNPMDVMWQDLLTYPMFKNPLIHHICHLAENMANYTGAQAHKFLALKSDDKERIKILQNEFGIDIDDVSQQRVQTCHQKLEDIIAKSAGAANEDNAKQAKSLIELIFGGNILLSSGVSDS